MIRRIPNSRIPERHGIILLAVTVVVVMLSLAAYQYTELMVAEYKAAISYRRSVQARALADSGLHYVAVILSNPTNNLTGSPYDNTQLFQNILVQQDDQTQNTGRFSVISPYGPDDSPTTGQSFRFGMIDEGGKINLNALLQLDSSGQIAFNMLMQLPNMTEDVANSIIDWLDPDDTERSNGAENTYYSSLSPPYRCKNGPLDSIEELLLVKGVTPQLLFGNDYNRNGVLDPEEDDGTGTVNLGWAAYLTIYSREQNLDSTGNPRIYVNDQNLANLTTTLTTAVGQSLANYIIAYRVYGPANTGQTGAGGGANVAGGGNSGVAQGRGPLQSNAVNTQNARAKSIASIYELINSYVDIPSQAPGGQPTRYPSPLNDVGTQQTLLPIVLDKLTTSQSSEIPGRVNVNTAPQAVLASLPNLTPADVQNIIANRPTPSSFDPTDPTYQTPAWLMTQAHLPAKTLQSLEKYVTARSQVYRIQVLGYFDGGGPTARIEAVIDANNGQPRILTMRDLTEIGKGYDMTIVNPNGTQPGSGGSGAGGSGTGGGGTSGQ